MFVVRRSFRNYNQMIVPGSVVEPDTIKRFKTRLRDRDIIEVSEQNFDKWNEYFIAKFGMPINIEAAIGTEHEPEVIPDVEPVVDAITSDDKPESTSEVEPVKNTVATEVKPIAKAVAKAIVK